MRELRITSRRPSLRGRYGERCRYIGPAPGKRRRILVEFEDGCRLKVHPLAVRPIPWPYCGERREGERRKLIQAPRGRRVNPVFHTPDRRSLRIDRRGTDRRTDHPIGSEDR